MTLFWKHIGQDVPAPAALRLAKREWLDGHPHYRDIPRAWAGLFVLGGIR